VTRAELLAAGLTRNEIEHRLRTDALIRVHRAVFRVGHQAPSIEARYMAAVKARGEEALLAGRAAGHLLHLLKRPPSLPEVLCSTERRIRGIRTHRVRRTELTDRTKWHGIPVTTVPRTIVDLAAVLEEDELAGAFHEAGVRHRTRPDSVERILSRRHNWPGSNNLRRVLRGDAPITLSRLEREFLARLRATCFPSPR